MTSEPISSQSYFYYVQRAELFYLAFSMYRIKAHQEYGEVSGSELKGLKGRYKLTLQKGRLVAVYNYNGAPMVDYESPVL